MKITTFWNARSCIWTEGQQRFGGTCCNHLQRMLLDTPEDDGSRSLPIAGLYKTTWYNITNDSNLHELCNLEIYNPVRLRIKEIIS
jgi:hypothetical protein